MTCVHLFKVAVASLLFVGIGAAWGAAPPLPTPTPPPDAAEIQAILTQVQDALETSAKDVSDLKMPSLASVTLTLQVSATQEVGGKVKFWIFSIGRSIQQETTQELVLTLTPPDLAKEFPAVRKPALAEQLVSAIVSAARGVQNARGGVPPLDLKCFEVTVAFVVVKNASGGGAFTIQPVTIELGGELKNKAIQKLKLVFKKP